MSETTEIPLCTPREAFMLMTGLMALTQLLHCHCKLCCNSSWKPRPGLHHACNGLRGPEMWPTVEQWLPMCLQDLIRRFGGIQKLVSLLASGAETECTHRALLALRILTDKEADRLAILRAGGVSLLVGLLSSGGAETWGAQVRALWPQLLVCQLSSGVAARGCRLDVDHAHRPHVGPASPTWG